MQSQQVSDFVPFKEALTLLRAKGETGYEREFPEPVLLLEPLGAGAGSAVDTPPEGSSFDQTSAEKVVAPQLFRAPIAGMVHPEAQVAWLRKTDRNPFVGLVTIGRARNNDIILAHSSVSKLHAIVHRHGIGWLIEDRNSTNGTFIEGVRLPGEERRALNDGTSLRIADAVQARFFEPGSFWSFCQLVGGL